MCGIRNQFSMESNHFQRFKRFIEREKERGKLYRGTIVRFMRHEMFS